jgi:Arc/MetJ family transcription regulator
MRTTLDIDDDVLEAAKERARRERKTAGQVVSALLRQALTAPAHHPGAVREPAAVYGFRPFPPGDTVVTNARIDDLRRDDAY